MTYESFPNFVFIRHEFDDLANLPPNLKTLTICSWGPNQKDIDQLAQICNVGFELILNFEDNEVILALYEAVIFFIRIIFFFSD